MTTDKYFMSAFEFTVKGNLRLVVNVAKKYRAAGGFFLLLNGGVYV